MVVISLNKDSEASHLLPAPLPHRPAQTSSGIYLPVKEILVDLKAESTDLIESQGKGQWSLYQDVEHVAVSVVA